ncbi:MAG: carotenoid biosynthesis protein [Actinobacteria bacterium]|nr:carotenoid biosynthesis protein [Actinomycetota bacterium]MBU1942697.1 carotenoid biosynthesis protein [Actinomycetota bacterium]MBU2686019.1 carotenoid biosynthesis protein [Actinomycetota bacterium]
MKGNAIVFEILVAAFFVVFYIGGARAMGRLRHLTFLAGAILFSLAIETTAVLAGLDNFYWYATNSYFKHYPLGGYVIWLGVVPLSVILLWYMVAMTSYVGALHILPSRSAWARAALAGGIATLFYLLIEPIAVANRWWVFNAKSFYLIDVPLFAVLGVFLSVFVFTLVFHWTITEPRDNKSLKKLEDRTVKRVFKSKKLAKNLSFHQLRAVFFFRLVVAFVAYGAVMSAIVVALWAVANRGQIKPTW